MAGLLAKCRCGGAIGLRTTGPVEGQSVATPTRAASLEVDGALDPAGEFVNEVYVDAAIDATVMRTGCLASIDGNIVVSLFAGVTTTASGTAGALGVSGASSDIARRIYCASPSRWRA